MQNKNLKIIKETTWDAQVSVGCNRFEVVCVFAEYDPTISIQNCYMWIFI